MFSGLSHQNTLHSVESKADGLASFLDWTSNARSSVRGTILLTGSSAKQTPRPGSGHLLFWFLPNEAFGKRLVKTEKEKKQVISLWRECSKYTLPFGRKFPWKQNTMPLFPRRTGWSALKLCSPSSSLDHFGKLGLAGCQFGSSLKLYHSLSFLETWSG